MARIGLLTMSDGRRLVARDIADFCRPARLRSPRRCGCGHESSVWASRLDQRSSTSQAAGRRRATRSDDLLLTGLGIPHSPCWQPTATPGPRAARKHRPAAAGHGRPAGRGGGLDRSAQPIRGRGATSRSRGGRPGLDHVRAGTPYNPTWRHLRRIGGRPMDDTPRRQHRQWLSTSVLTSKNRPVEIVRRSDLVEEARVAPAIGWLEKNAAAFTTTVSS